MEKVIYEPKAYTGEDIPFFEYPRPQLKRDSYFCLNGEWDFCIRTTEEISYEYDRKILVPFPPEASLSGLGITPDKGELMHYRRFFSLPEGFIKHRVLLHFGAADQIATVYLNGKLLGSHEGGYHPFSFDITDYLLKTNELTVCVRDDLCTDYPYGKQTNKRGGMWYTKTSGIWQTVWIESVPENYIRSIRITPSLTSVTIEVDSNAKEKTLKLFCEDEALHFATDSITFTPNNIHLWTPEDPYLYNFTLKADEDIVQSYFALRSIDVRKINGIPRVCLNGRPYFIQALLDQGYYPDGLFLPSSPKGYEKDILSAKSMGYNTLRKHIKIEPLLFYHACDKLGMIVFQDFVNNSSYSFLRDTALPTIGFIHKNDKNSHKSKKSRALFKDGMLKTIRHLYNVPSLLIYTVFNEGWGQFCADEVFALAKENDPTRLYDATSGWFIQNQSDFHSLHIYFKPLKIKKASEKPLLISEFGGYSLRIDGHLATDKNYGYSRFEDTASLFSALKKLYTDQALPLVEKGLCGLVYTQIADVEDETNGLLSYDREVQKVDIEKMKEMLSAFEKSYAALI